RATAPVRAPPAEGEITQPFCSGRQTTFDRRRIQPDAFIFLAHKKEELVFLNRSVEVPTEIVEAQLRFHRREEKSRVEFVVTEKLEGAAVIRVAATARDDIDRGAGVAPVFSGEV